MSYDDFDALQSENAELREALAAAHAQIARLRAGSPTLPRKLRAGRTVGRTIYDADTGELVGVLDTRELAAAVVAAFGGRDGAAAR